MSSKRAIKRREYRKRCEGKRRHKTRNDAMIEIMNSKIGHGLTPYRCKFCGYWHVGHMPKHRSA